MIAVNSYPKAADASTVPYPTAEEAYDLINFQLERLLELLETLAPEDWSQPTACTAWTVRDMVAHQAGGYASGTSYREMMRQYSRIPKKGQLPEDAVNEMQVQERAGRSPAELIEELRASGPAAAHNWAYGFRLVRLVSIPHPVGGLLSLQHLFWVIHSRDTWMHRLDICRATGRKFEQTAGQDERIVALVMRDVGKRLEGKLGGKAILFHLTGTGGGTWKVGRGELAASIQMDVLEFNIFASGRDSYEAALQKASISGEIAWAQAVMKDILILY